MKNIFSNCLFKKKYCYKSVYDKSIGDLKKLYIHIEIFYLFSYLDKHWWRANKRLLKQEPAVS